MTTLVLPQVIQAVLDLIEEQGYEDTFNGLDQRDKDLTATLCCSDCADFIAMDGEDAFLFAYNEQTDTWEVSHIGQPVYHVERGMVGDVDEDFDFDGFVAEIRHNLPGVAVVAASSENEAVLKNSRSEFVEQFRPELDEAFNSALANY